MGALAAGAAVAYGLGKVAKIGWDEFNAGQKEAAQTAAVLESTGGIANVTAQHVEDLSRMMLRQTGIDDELLHSSQNVLLTFTHLRNEVGKGNDIFDQAAEGDDRSICGDGRGHERCRAAGREGAKRSRQRNEPPAESRRQLLSPPGEVDHSSERNG